jgi:hypothetical protein
MDVVAEMKDEDEVGSVEDVELGGGSEDGAVESSEEENQCAFDGGTQGDGCLVLDF